MISSRTLGLNHYNWIQNNSKRNVTKRSKTCSSQKPRKLKNQIKSNDFKTVTIIFKKTILKKIIQTKCLFWYFWSKLENQMTWFQVDLNATSRAWRRKQLFRVGSAKSAAWVLPNRTISCNPFCPGSYIRCPIYYDELLVRVLHDLFFSLSN